MKVIADVGLNEHLNIDDANAIALKRKGTIRINASEKLSSAKLFGSHNEVMIQHQDETYILRLTKQNKLILTK